MPAFDEKGPMGLGPMTGWGRGRCVGAGCAARRGFGFRVLRCRQRLGAGDEQALLTEEVQAVSKYLKELQARLKEPKEGK
ncbi:hypothetical protein AUJ46_05395 [Candidatus Peregrinibacteria bacterium CG1_02_54_53]|nr:MAG: hypothetical protein AUJ46_05395 [Candidatus Peregrinibacteria bacterium CG1_02_54_53]